MTSYGILSIGGLISLTIGSIMLFEDVGVSLKLMLPTILLVGGFFVVVAGLAFRAYRAKPMSGADGLLGEMGVVKELIDPEGLVFVHGEYWRAKAGERIEPGEKVEVEGVEGLALYEGQKRMPEAIPIKVSQYIKTTKEDNMFYILAIVLIVLFLVSAIKILKEYERGVIFRLGRVIKTKGPGLIILIPVIDKMVKVSLRLVAMDVPPQDVITRDNVSVKVNAVIYFGSWTPPMPPSRWKISCLPRHSWPRPPCEAYAGRWNWMNCWRKGKRSTPSYRTSWINTPIPGASR